MNLTSVQGRQKDSVHYTVLSRADGVWSSDTIAKLRKGLAGLSAHTCQRLPKIVVLDGHHEKGVIQAALGIAPSDFDHQVVTGRANPAIPFTIPWND